MLGAKNKNDGEYTPAEIMADILSDLDLLASASDLNQMVEAGAILWQVQHAANKTLEAFKTKLRAEGVKRYEKTGEHEITIRSEDAWATIKIPNASVVVRKDADLSALRAKLGETFSDLFVRTVSYKTTSDFEERAADVDPALRDELLAAIDRQENTPRISFRRKDPTG